MKKQTKKKLLCVSSVGVLAASVGVFLPALASGFVGAMASDDSITAPAAPVDALTAKEGDSGTYLGYSYKVELVFVFEDFESSVGFSEGIGVWSYPYFNDEYRLGSTLLNIHEGSSSNMGVSLTLGWASNLNQTYTLLLDAGDQYGTNGVYFFGGTRYEYSAFAGLVWSIRTFTPDDSPVYSLAVAVGCIYYGSNDSYWDGYRQGYSNGEGDGYSKGYEEGFQKGSEGKASTEVIDIWSTIGKVISMPFTFVSTAFDSTLFSGTPYEFNVGVLISSVFSVILVVSIFKLIIGFFI